MLSIDVVGYLAGALTSIAFAPQVVRTWRTKSAGDLSLVTLTMFTAGVSLWLVYGIQVRSVPVILANLLTLGQGALLVALRLRHGARTRTVPGGGRLTSES